MNSICRYVSSPRNGGELKTVHFVYETEFHKMKQPFFHPIYYLYLVTRGSGTLRSCGKAHSLEVGSLFLGYPGIPYRIDGSKDFTYMYVSFMGARAMELVQGLRLTELSPAAGGYAELIPFWKQTIQRIRPGTEHLLTESTLLYTLSFLTGELPEKTESSPKALLENILNFTENHFSDPELSLKKIADIFSYTDKYLSRLFKAEMKVNWNTYLTQIRIQYAQKLIFDGISDIPYLSAKCGFRDPSYFSKIFKRDVGESPRSFIKNRKGDPADRSPSF